MTKTPQRPKPRSTSAASSRLVLHGQGHGAGRRAPERVAAAIARFIDEDLPPR